MTGLVDKDYEKRLEQWGTGQDLAEGRSFLAGHRREAADLPSDLPAQGKGERAKQA